MGVADRPADVLYSLRYMGIRTTGQATGGLLSR